MSWQPAKEPVVAADRSPDPVEMAIVPRNAFVTASMLSAP